MNFYLLKKALSLNLSLLNVKCQKCFSSHFFYFRNLWLFYCYPKKGCKNPKSDQIHCSKDQSTTKRRPWVNFINILQVDFAPIFLCPKLQSWNVTKKRCMKHFCTKKRQDLNDSLYNLVGRLTGLNCIFSNSPLYSFFFSIPLQSRKVL